MTLHNTLIKPGDRGTTNTDGYVINVPRPYNKQLTIIYAQKRFKVIVAGRRVGKTTSAIIALLSYGVKNPNSVLYYVAPTYKQAKNIAWSMLLRFVNNAYLKKNEQELYIKIPNGTEIYLKGADAPDSLRGVKVNFCILDEYADMKPMIFDEIIRPMITDSRGLCWFLGTPRGFDHFHKLWKEVNEGKKGNDWIAFRLKTADNPYILRSEIEKARKESDPRSFAQEWEAEFVTFSGLVFQGFRRPDHVETFDIEKIKGIDLCGLDFGADHPTCASFGRITVDGHVYIWGEYCQREKDFEEHVKGFKVVRGKKFIRQWFCDPSAKQMMQEMKKLGITAKPAVNDRSFGISLIRGLLEKKKLHIHPDCGNLIYEFEHHRYKTEKESRGDIKKDLDVIKKDDDMLDATRYMLSSYFKRRHSADEMFANSTGEYSLDQGVRRAFDLDNLDNNTWATKVVSDTAPEFILNR